MEFKAGDRVAYNASSGIEEGTITRVIPAQYHIKLDKGGSTICSGDIMKLINEE